MHGEIEPDGYETFGCQRANPIELYRHHTTQKILYIMMMEIFEGFDPGASRLQSARSSNLS